MMTREERLRYLRAMRAFIEAPPGEGVEPRDPRGGIPRKPLVLPTPVRSDGNVGDQAAYLMARHARERTLAAPALGAASDKAAHLMAEAVKTLLRS